MQIPESGEFSRRVVIALQIDAPSGFGFSSSYQPQFERWAKVEPIHAIQTRFGAQIGDVPTHWIWIMYGPQTTPEAFTKNHAVLWRGRIYRVMGAINPDDAQIVTRLDVKDLGMAP